MEKIVILSTTFSKLAFLFKVVEKPIDVDTLGSLEFVELE